MNESAFYHCKVSLRNNSSPSRHTGSTGLFPACSPAEGGVDLQPPDEAFPAFLQENMLLLTVTVIVTVTHCGETKVLQGQALGHRLLAFSYGAKTETLNLALKKTKSILIKI